jgi:two-component system chemotaxis response regulator CheY
MMPMPTILIVDDDRTTVRLLQTLLELDGFHVHSTARGSEVPAVIADKQPDLLLMDYHLIDMDGLAVIRGLRAVPETARLPIVMASGMNVEIEAKEAGATAFLVKPFEPDALSELFNRLIDGGNA